MLYEVITGGVSIDLGWLTRSENGAGEAIQFVYNDGGDLLKLIDGAGQSTEFTVNRFGWVVAEQDANGEVTEYTLDASGNRIEERSRRTDESGSEREVIIRHSYDAMGRQLTTTDGEGATQSTEYNERNNFV